MRSGGQVQINDLLGIFALALLSLISLIIWI
jgi:hypothetical protein